MGLFDIFRKNQKGNNIVRQQNGCGQPLPAQEIVNMAKMHEPLDIYEYDNQGRKHLTGVVREAVESIMSNYDGGVMNISMALMLNEPEEMQQKIENSDVDTLLLFFKFLATEANYAQNKDIIAPVQQFLIRALQKKLS